MCGDTRPPDPVLPGPSLMRTSSLDELRQLCRGIRKSFVHLETRDSYGTETELPHLARWRRSEPDDYAWLEGWLEMLRGYRAAGRTCRRARVVSEPPERVPAVGAQLRCPVHRRRRGHPLGAASTAGQDIAAGQRGLLRLRRHPGHVLALRRERHQHRIRDHRRAARRPCLPGSIRARLADRHPAS
jgi:hypothetical protein